MPAPQNLIRFYRDKAGLTQKESAKRIEVSVNIFQQWEYEGASNAKRLLDLVGLFVECGVMNDYPTAQRFWQQSGREVFPEPPELQRLFDPPSVPIPATPPASADSAPTIVIVQHRYDWRLWLVAGLISVLLLLLIVNVRFRPLQALPGITPTANNNRNIVFVERNGQMIQLEDSRGIMKFASDSRFNNPSIYHAHEPMSSGDTLTVSFAIQNIDSVPITVRALTVGMRGPNAYHDEWKGRVIEFPSVDIVLEPEQIYEYRQSVVLYTPGDYMVEPIFQNNQSRWSNIYPNRRVYLDVEIPTKP